MDHGQIWRAIDALAARRGLSASGLARAAGLDPTTFNKSKRKAPDGKPRWPSTESLTRALDAAQTNWDEFAALMAGREGAGRAIPIVAMSKIAGMASAGANGFFDQAGFPIGADETGRLPELGEERAYALEIGDDRFEPMYRAGDMLIVQPGAAVRRGDRVLVRTHAGEVTGKILGRRNEQTIEFISLDCEGAPCEFSAASVDWIARIVWASQ